MFELPVGVSHQSQTPIVPCYFSQEGEHNQQPLEVQNKQWPSFWTLLDPSSLFLYSSYFYSSFKNILLAVLYLNSEGCEGNTKTEGLVLVQIQLKSCRNELHLTDLWTHQEAHKVKGKDSRHPAKRQALEHCTANSGWVTVVPGGGIGRWCRAALSFGAPLHPPDGHH